MAFDTNASGGLLDTVKSFLTPEMMQQMTRHVGEPVERVQSGVQTAVPALLAGVVQKGSSESGARDLLNIMRETGFDQVMQPQNLMERVDQTAPQQGQGMLSNLFGSRLGGIADLISRKSGLSAASSHSLLGFLAPIVFGVLGMRSQGLNASGLVSMLAKQKDSVFSALPQGFSQASNVRDLGTERLNRASEDVRQDAHDGTENKNRWVWPVAIVALLAAGMIWMNRDRQQDQNVVESQATTGTMGGVTGAEQLQELTPNQIMRVQQALSQRGYDVPVDGAPGGTTLDALRDFQMKNGIDGNGMVNAETVRQLSLPSDFFEQP